METSVSGATQTELLNESIERYGKPEIINSDQGSQYTSKNWFNCLKGHEIRISMDGKGRATDNVYVERFFRSIMDDYIYLNPAETGLDLYLGAKNFIEEYNQRRHQGIENKRPKDLYKLEKTIQLKSA
ncbi:integrase core domain-containing protein [Weeksella virosa]|uniref:integrase core domain-containing protein n=1 Tax=Weeksella virosa TaxID=1014 RepID=UPI0032B80FBD